ncbi:Protein of unknown function DUF1997 [Nannochloropsis gaditana]|uniref:Uncharacterized protein n=1 Tax=Nannochloropsis gaditana TaxID=72520 RepID=W7TV56_9STRA|nr:Protein of unknown function DUF1997 [Nannochloropsis gaditana]
MAPIQFFTASIVPVVDVRLTVDAVAGTAVIRAISGQVKHSTKPLDLKEAQEAGYVHTGPGRFDELSFQMDTTNIVSWQKVDDRTVALTSRIEMEISMEKPGWMLVPSSMMNRVGSMVLHRILKKTLPEFLDRIKNGYTGWEGEMVV